MDVMGLISPLMHQPLLGHDPEKGCRDVRGLDGETSSATSCRFEPFQSWARETPARYRDENGEHFVSGAGCRGTTSCSKLHEEARRWESSAWIAATD